MFLIFILAFFAIFAPHAHAATPVQDVLSPGNAEGDAVRKVWNSLLGFANSIMVVVLIIIAFSNILHIQIDNYAIKKSLPALVVALVLANFSYLICRAIIDVANMILKFIMETKSSSIADIRTSALAGTGGTTTSCPQPPGPDFWGTAWSCLGQQVVKIVGAVMVTILSYLLFIRNWLIYFLVALSPVAFVAMAIPQGKGMFTLWWKQFIQWTFMPVIAGFWLYVGGLFVNASVIKNAGTLMMSAFAIACYYMAMTTPFKYGGAIMKKWGDYGNKAWKNTGAAAGKWVGSGGFQNYMTYRNQMLAAREGAKKTPEGDAAEKKYKARAERWTKMNPKLRYDAYKARYEHLKGSFASAPIKTKAYAGWMGGGTAVKAGVEANQDDFKTMSLPELGREVRGHATKVWNSLDASTRKGYEDEALARATEGVALGYSDTTSFAQHLLMQKMAKTGDDKIASSYGHLGLSEFELGEAKAGFIEYIRTSRSNKGVQAINSFSGAAPAGGTATPLPAPPGGGAAASPATPEITAAVEEAVHSPQLTQGVIAAVEHGGLGEYAERHGFDAATRQALQHATININAERVQMVAKESQYGQERLDNRLSGIKTAYDAINAQFAGGKRYNLEDMSTKVAGAQEALAKGDYQNAAAIAKFVAPAAVEGIQLMNKPDEEKAKLAETLNQLKQGLEHFQQQSPLSMRAIMNAGWSNYEQQIKPSYQQAVQQTSEAVASSHVVMGERAQQIASTLPADSSLADISQMHEEQMQAAAQQMQDFSDRVADINNELGRKMTKLDFASKPAMAQQAIASAAKATYGEEGMSNVKTGDAFNNKEFLESLSRAVSLGMRRAAEQKPLHVKVTNQPTPAPAQPPTSR